MKPSYFFQRLSLHSYFPTPSEAHLISYYRLLKLNDAKVWDLIKLIKELRRQFIIDCVCMCMRCMSVTNV